MDYRNSSCISEEGLIVFTLYPYQVVLHPIIFLIGVPLNLFVALVLLSRRKLRQQVRNAGWLGIIVSNLINFFLMPLEYFILYEQSYLACQILSVAAGKPYVVLLVNLFIATCERFIYTKWPRFHQKHVTVKRILAIQLFTSVSAFLALTFKFWTLEEPIRCGVEPSYIKVSMVAIVLFIILCIVMKLAVYFLLIKKSKGIKSARVVSRAIKVKELSTSSSSGHSRKGCVRLYVPVRSQNVLNMERKATVTLVFGLIPLCLSAILYYVYTVWQILCDIFFAQCSTLQSLSIYFLDLSLLHVSVDLLAYIFRSVEFRNAARQMFRRLC